jgi:hypothetical protein
MRRTRHIAGLVVAASTLVAAPAGAAPLNELSASAGVDSAYDGNVYNSRGPDWVNRITPHVSYELIDPRIKLGTFYDFSYWTYALGKAESSYNHHANVSLEAHPTRRLTLKVSDEFFRAEDPGFLSRAGVAAPPIGIFENVADAFIGMNIVRRVYAGLAYTYLWAQFDPYTAAQAATYPALFDGAEHDAVATTTFAVTRLDDLRFAGRFQLFTAGPQAGNANLWDVGATYSPTLGWRHQILRDLEATADAGPVFYQSLDGSANVLDANGVRLAPSSGTTWRAGAQVRWFTPTWRAAVSYTHDLVGATGAGNALWADAVYAQTGYDFFDKVDAHAGFGYFRNGPALNQPWAYDGVTGDVAVDWRIINYLHLGAYYTLRWQEAGPVVTGGAQFPSTTRNIVGVRLLAVVGADARPPQREVHP